MSEMIERVARVLCEADYPHEAGGEMFEHYWHRKAEAYRKIARAAIEAMREPTEAIKKDSWIYCGSDWERCWKAAIDAALK